jgi:lipopolysaccharide transport system permease protein
MDKRTPDLHENVTVIRPPTGWSWPDLRELMHSADLLYLLAKRDVTIRYRQTAVGVLWAVLQPLILTAIFAVFLGQLAGVSSGGAPYGLFALSGMTLWLFMASGLTKTSESTLSSATLISKVYFPRMVVPMAALVPPLVDFVVALVVLLAALVLFGEGLEPQLLLLPVVLAVAALVILGAGLWLSAIIVRYHDVSLVVPFLILVLLWISPVLYPLSLIPDEYHVLYVINPMVGLLETFRWVVLEDASSPGLLLLVPAATGLFLLVTGALYFNRAERRFADVI